MSKNIAYPTYLQGTRFSKIPFKPIIQALDFYENTLSRKFLSRRVRAFPA
jgi:hypothetical protein